MVCHEHREAMSFDLTLPQSILRKRCRLNEPALPNMYEGAGKLVFCDCSFEWGGDLSWVATTSCCGCCPQVRMFGPHHQQSSLETARVTASRQVQGPQSTAACAAPHSSSCPGRGGRDCCCPGLLFRACCSGPPAQGPFFLVDPRTATPCTVLPPTASCTFSHRFSSNSICTAG